MERSTKVVSFFDEPFPSSSSAAADVNNTNDAVPPLTEHQKRLVGLASLVAQFLLSDILAEDNNKMEEGEKVTTSTNTEKKTTSRCPLDYFQQPGGVMYLVMSLVETRGIDRIRSGTFSLLLFLCVMLP